MANMYALRDIAPFSTGDAIGARLRFCFDRIYIINLASRLDRRQEIEHQLNIIGLSIEDSGVELFEAVRPDDKGQWPSIGARGCFFSHLGILNDAVERGASSILILEDDVDWAAGFLKDAEHALGFIESNAWDFLHGGRTQTATGRPEFEALNSDKAAQLTHFIALRGRSIKAARDYLTEITKRPAGDPNGGPMHVDGAYSWFRKDVPEVRGFIAQPALAEQRSSMSDIADKKWFDRLPLISAFAGTARTIKRRVTA